MTSWYIVTILTSISIIFVLFCSACVNTSCRLNVRSASLANHMLSTLVTLWDQVNCVWTLIRWLLWPTGPHPLMSRGYSSFLVLQITITALFVTLRVLPRQSAGC